MDVSQISSSAAWSAAPAAPARGPQRTTQAVADLLGMSADDLRTALRQGSTMADLAKGAGVDEDDLESTIAGTLPATGPDGATAADRAAEIAQGRGPEHHPHGRPPAGSGTDATGPGTDAAGGLAALSGALGVSSTELLQRLTDGSGISDLLAGNPDVAAQLTASQNKGSLVDGWA